MNGALITSYSMSWQVDGGMGNSMYDSYNDHPHKEAVADVSAWSWRGTGPYTITFTARDGAGKVLAQRSVKVSIAGRATATTTANPTTPAAASEPVADSEGSSSEGSGVASVKLYVDSYSPASRQASEWRSSRPLDAAQMDKIAAHPRSFWFGGWNNNVSSDVSNVVTAATAKGEVPVLVLYNIPQRDCGGHSSGGTTVEGYKSWIRAVASGIAGRRAIVILEPDSLAQIDCLPAADQTTRFTLLTDALTVLKASSAISVYLDAGHANWIGAEEMSARLTKAGLAKADGFSLNASNFVTTENNIAYGTQVSRATGGKHFVIDTSRNGAGPAADGQWCNPLGRALGKRPTTNTGNSSVDAFLWIKYPGESDGSCNGGPAAGQWWADYALGLAQRAAY
ncbi:MAG TPA: glycoside hydrolase family 6 protein [Candidatus Saccharimonadales bacterium]|nr:glycoside hydrolase family 6 protein [Candidatus Saccharimonadales bacterium]